MFTRRKKEMERNPGIFSLLPLFVRFHQAGVSVGNEYVKISISNEKWHLRFQNLCFRLHWVSYITPGSKSGTNP